MYIKKRNDNMEKLDISKIQKQTREAVAGLNNVCQSTLELEAQIKFVDGMSSTDLQHALIHTAVDKIDVDCPDWTFVAARLLLNDLYHRVGRAMGNTKGEQYPNLELYLECGINNNRLIPTLGDGYDLQDLNDYLVPSRDLQFNYLGIKTLYDRYLIKDTCKEPIELPQLMFMGVAMFLAQNEDDKQTRAKEFYDVLSKFEVMVATPTLSNARTTRHQLSSCYIGSTPDSADGIVDTYKEMALLSKFGGGIGWDWTQVRGLGSSINGHTGAAGGPIPFLKVVNDISIAFDQLGTRKGAIATYKEPWHSDIEDFIDLKKNSGEERRRAHDIFTALWIPDLFMERVKADEDWTLFSPDYTLKLYQLNNKDFKKAYENYEKYDSIKRKVVKAKDLWKKILASYVETGSPFLCFKDAANRANPNSHVGVIRSSNLCTEIFQNTEPNMYKIKITYDDGSTEVIDKDCIVVLGNGTSKRASNVTSLDTLVTDMSGTKKKVYVVEREKVDGKTAVCNLASINLSKINTKESIERVTKTAVRMLDNVVDLNYYPFKKVKDTNMASRSIGLGVMGEAQMLAEAGIHWGTQTHMEFIDKTMEYVSYYTISASSDLAVERGNYPDYTGSNWNKGILPMDHAKEEVINLTKRDTELDWEQLRLKTSVSMRNGYLMAVAPTSSISIIVGTTQTIEPIYKRKWFEENSSGLIPVTAPNLNPDTWSFYRPAYEIEQMNLVIAAAIRQKWIDQGQSLNIFVDPSKVTGKYLNDLYMLAYTLGLKSTYYLRSLSPKTNDVQDRSIECNSCQ